MKAKFSRGLFVKLTKARRDQAVKAFRKLWTETLESRTLMASDFWNPNNPYDVNNDHHISPIDAVLIIDDINAKKAGQLNGNQSSAGVSGFVDVNNDGVLSPIDALKVISNLNGQGEGNEVLSYRLTAYPGNITRIPDPLNPQPGDPTPITTVARGQDYILVARVSDLRATPKGVFSAYADININPQGGAQTTPSLNETQQINIQGATGGSFRLTFNGNQTAAINFTSNQQLLATRIQAALQALPGVNGNVVVDVNNIAIPGAPSGVRINVRFINGLGEQDLPEMTAQSALTPGTATVAVSTLAQGLVQGKPTDFLNASYNPTPAVLQSGGDITGANNPSTFFFPNARLDALLGAAKFDDLGGFGSSATDAPTIGPGFFNSFVVRMNADKAGMVTFTLGAPDADIVAGTHDIAVYEFGRELDPATEVLFQYETPTGVSMTPLKLTITAEVGVTPDTYTVNEDTPTTLSPSPLANDTIATAGSLRITQVTAGSQGGTLAIINNGADVRYTPALNFNGVETFNYTISDGLGHTDTGLITINVTAVNDAPTLTLPGAQTTPEDVALIFGTGNRISVADVDATEVELRLQVNQGTLTLGSVLNVTQTGDGSSDVRVRGTVANVNAAVNGLQYLGPQDFSGSATLTATVSDLGGTGTGGVLTATGTVTITVTAVNDAPVNVLPPNQNVTENETLEFSAANSNRVNVTDVDAGTGQFNVQLTVDSGILTLASTTNVTVTGNGSGDVTIRGTLANVQNALGVITFTPPANFLGDVSFRMRSNDNGNTGAGGARTDDDTITISVEPGVRPRARNDRFGFSSTLPDFIILEDGGTVRLNVLANDVPNVSALVTLVSFTSPLASQGTVARFDNGTPANLTDDQINFTPATNFNGDLTFTYTINDTSGAGANSTATVTVRVTNTNDAPVAVNDSYSTNEDTLLSVDAPGVLANDTDIDPSDTRTALLVSNPSNGSVTLDPNGSFIYTPNANFNGNDSFTYRAVDAAGLQSNIATVAIVVNPVNDAPTAVADSYNATEDETLNVVAPGVLSNDTDPDNATSSLEAVVETQPSHGTLTLNLNGSFSYVPNANFNGNDSFTYRARDPLGLLSAPATVTIVVAAVNDNPPIADDNVRAFSNLPNQEFDVLANDIALPNPDGPETLTLQSVQSPTQQGGTVTIVNGKVSYTPAPNFVGADQFTYTISDGKGGSSTATVFVTVIDSIPSDVSGFVYFDQDNDGVFDSNERGVKGVEVHIVGVNFVGDPVNLTVMTDINGFYIFPLVRPGKYDLIETTPEYVIDGKDTIGKFGGTKPGNDTFRFELPISGTTDATGYNFGERGVDPKYLTIQEILATSTNKGFIVAMNNSGEQLWSTKMNGWDGLQSMSVSLSSDGKSATVTAVFASGTVTKTINTVNNPRFRIMGKAADGVIVRIDGTAADLGMTPPAATLAARDAFFSTL